MSYVQIHPVSSPAIWGFGETSYPYLGYIFMDLEFHENFIGSKESLFALTLICPGPWTPDRIPVILGTNARLFKHLAKISRETAGMYFIIWQIVF